MTREESIKFIESGRKPNETEMIRLLDVVIDIFKEVEVIFDNMFERARLRSETA